MVVNVRHIVLQYVKRCSVLSLSDIFNGIVSPSVMNITAPFKVLASLPSRTCCTVSFQFVP